MIAFLTGPLPLERFFDTRTDEGDDLYGTDFGEPQTLEHLAVQVLEKDSIKRIRESREYRKGLDRDKGLMDLCKNKHESCTVWAIAGECTKNPGYMNLHVSLAKCFEGLKHRSMIS
jgi:hypothetical protein